MSYNGENVMVLDEAWIRMEMQEDYDHYPEPQPVECEDCGRLITHGKYCRGCCFAEIETLMFKVREHLGKSLERARAQEDFAKKFGILQANIMMVQKSYMDQLMKLSKEVGDDA